jgi:S1-C subfamily serine protease
MQPSVAWIFLLVVTLANIPKAEGVIVGGTKDGGDAAKCGILAGDIILRYGRMDVKDVRALARTAPGTVVNLLVWPSGSISLLGNPFRGHEASPSLRTERVRDLPQNQ